MALPYAFEYNGKRWRAERTGGSHDVEGLHSVGVAFVCEPTGTTVYSSLNPVDVERPTDARLIDALESALLQDQRIGVLTLNAMMWANDGPELKRENPIQYEVRGLPNGFEPIFVGQNLMVRPIRWRVLRRRAGVHGWGDDFDTPEAALAALQNEFRKESF